MRTQLRAVVFSFAMVANAALALFPPHVGAQGYPTKPVKMVVGFPSGGGTDILARIVAQKLSKQLNIKVE